MAEETFPFSTRTDMIIRGDKNREIVPFKITNEDGFTVYHFQWQMFYNPKYKIPEESGAMFKSFIVGDSRAYSSDGKIPAIRAAIEARKIIQEVRHIAADKEHPFYQKAKKAVMNGYAQVEDISVVRGTIGLMLGKWMPKDWQKRRYTDDIDFFWETIDNDLWNHVLNKLGWTTDDATPGTWSIWKKMVIEVPGVPLECSNDTTLSKQFGGADATLDGPGLKAILKFKFFRCHDIDINDIINVAIMGLLNIEEDEPNHPWRAVMETLWRGGMDDIAHLIAICQHSFPIATHILKVANALKEHVQDFFIPNVFPDEEIKRIYSMQTPVIPGGTHYYWEPFQAGTSTDVKEMRKELYRFFLDEAEKRFYYGSRVRSFGHTLVWALNRRFKPSKVRFVFAKDIES